MRSLSLRPLTATMTAVGLAITVSCADPSRESAESLADGPTGWVKIYNPRHAANGYTLTLHQGRRPVLIDMNGRTVHSWPQARVKSRVRLLQDGSLLALALSRAVVEYDWEGKLVWRYDVAPDLPHHDVIRLANGNTMFPVLPRDRGFDEILEVDQSGTVVWRWQAREHLKEFISKQQARRRRDVTHINSIQELPYNPWFEAGDHRFRPGNILLSARNLNQIFVVDKTSQQVVWSYGDQLDLQHEALMIPQGQAGAGNIVLFDNGYRNTYRYRKSRLVEIDPRDGSVVWEYSSDDFYSPTAGVQQPLANGNFLVGSSRGGRIFEIDRSGAIHWQWAPPFEPVRPSRYEPDHCPQLAELGLPEAVAIRPPADYRHVDWPVSVFASKSEQRRSKLEGNVQTVLADNNDCRTLLLPASPRVWVSYGVGRHHVAAAGRESYAATFALRLRPRGATEWQHLFEDTVDVAGKRWHVQEFPLDSLELEWIELCVETREVGASRETPTEPFAFWNGPKITSGLAAEPEPVDASPGDDLTDEELDVRRRHLEALGYVN